MMKESAADLNDEEKSEKSKVEAPLSFSRDSIDLKALKALKRLFVEAQELSQEQFVEAFTEVLGKNLSEQELTHLFMKIDANCDGAVDWDEFTDFLFLNSAEDKGSEREEESAQYLAATIDFFKMNNGIRTFHRDSIMSLRFLREKNRIMSASADGVVSFWHPTKLSHESSFRASLSTRRKFFLTDSVVLEASNKLAVSSLDEGVSIFDMATGSFKSLFKIPLKRLCHCAPLRLGYFFDQSKQIESLQIGDDRGCVHVYNMPERIWNFSDEGILRNTAGQALEDSAAESRRNYRLSLECHDDHITHVEYVPALSSLLSSSLDRNISILDMERGKLRRKFEGHKKAVFTFTWSVAKLVASAGLEREITLWSPFSNRKVASLRGHGASIRKLASNEDNWQILSLSADNTLKVWDLRNHKCVQTLSSAGEDSLENVPVSKPAPVQEMIFVSDHKSIITASTRLRIFPLRPVCDAFEARAHNSLVVRVLFNSNFQQIVSLDERGGLRLWNMDSGACISKLGLRNSSEMDEIDLSSSKLAAGVVTDNIAVSHDAVDAAKEISASIQQGENLSLFQKSNFEFHTAACFDHSGRRILTGSSEGSCLRIWNFSNGSLLKTLVKAPFGEDGARMAKSEVTAVVHASISGQNNFVLSVGHDGKIFIWKDDSSENDAVQGYYACLPLQIDEMSRNCHQGEISSVTLCSPDLLVTAGADGQVLVWSIATKKFIRKLHRDKLSIENVVMVEDDHSERLVVFSREDGAILGTKWRNNEGLRAQVISNLGHERKVTCLEAEGTILAAGDDDGFLHVWELSWSLSNRIRRVETWKGHETSITSVALLDDGRFDILLLSSCGEGRVALATLLGETIGFFGDSKISWDRLGSVPKANGGLETLSAEDVEDWNLITEKHCQQEKNEGITELFPKRDDVWVKTFSPGLHAAQISPKEAMDALTVALVDYMTETVKGIDGNGDNVTITFAEIHSAQKGSWILDKHLSKFIGKVFAGKDDVFRAVSCVFSQSRDQWRLLDSNGETHDLPQKIKTFWGLQPTRSISIFLQRRSMIEKLAGDEETTKEEVSQTETETSNMKAEKVKSATVVRVPTPPSLKLRRNRTKSLRQQQRLTPYEIDIQGIPMRKKKTLH